MKTTNFWKQYLILISVFIILIQTTLAQEVNLALDGTPSTLRDLEAFFDGCPDYFGYGLNWIDIPSRLNDNIANEPAFGVTSYSTLDGTAGFMFAGRIDLPQPSTINQIDVIYRGIVYPGFNYMMVWILQPAGWSLVANIDPYSIYGDSMANWQTYQFSDGAPWQNVQSVFVRVRTEPLAPAFCVAGYISEIRAWGTAPQYQDIDLRAYNGTQTVIIAAEIGSPNSPSRISKNGVTYGIALVNPGGPKDSGLRIQTSSGIKALRKI